MAASLEPETIPRGSTRAGADPVKEHGVHYTPPELADFLARRLLAHLDLDRGQVSVLDPAAGEGELLGAAVAAAGRSARRLALVGIERDELAAARGRTQLAGLGASTELVVG